MELSKDCKRYICLFIHPKDVLSFSLTSRDNYNSVWRSKDFWSMKCIRDYPTRYTNKYNIPFIELYKRLFGKARIYTFNNSSDEIIVKGDLMENPEHIPARMSYYIYDGEAWLDADVWKDFEFIMLKFFTFPEHRPGDHWELTRKRNWPIVWFRKDKIAEFFNNLKCQNFQHTDWTGKHGYTFRLFSSVTDSWGRKWKIKIPGIHDLNLSLKEWRKLFRNILYETHFPIYEHYEKAIIIKRII